MPLQIRGLGYARRNRSRWPVLRSTHNRRRQVVQRLFALSGPLLGTCPSSPAEFADVPGQEAWGAASVVTCGEFRGLSYRYEQDGSTWQRWYLCNGATLLFVTYNGASGVIQHELFAVSAVLDSLRVEREA